MRPDQDDTTLIDSVVRMISRAITRVTSLRVRAGIPCLAGGEMAGVVLTRSLGRFKIVVKEFAHVVRNRSAHEIASRVSHLQPFHPR